MQIAITPGRYVVAVSGGVDSMVLLDVLTHTPGVDLVVAHFDHGIREDSGKDRELVARTANAHGLLFEYEEADLGRDASEAYARTARYAFLRKVKEQYKARAIITAHHQDDWIETAVINMNRGTGRKGLSSLSSDKSLVRPLLDTPKNEIVAYATAHSLVWREDSTNQDDRFMRNYIRHHILPLFDKLTKRQFVGYLHKAEALNKEIDFGLQELLDSYAPGDEMNRAKFSMLPYDVSCEIMAAWLRQNGIREFDRKTIARLVVAGKVAQIGKQADINAEYLLNIGRGTLQVSRRTFSQ